MLCSRAVWLRLNADLKSRRLASIRLSKNLAKPLSKYPELLEKVRRVMSLMEQCAAAVQLLGDRAHPLELAGDSIQELFAQPDFAAAAKSFDQCREGIISELRLWQPAVDLRRDADIEMTLSLFRQCEAIREEEDRILSLCQVLMWLSDDALHFDFEKELIASRQAGAVQ